MTPPPSNPVGVGGGGVITPTALSKVGKYAFVNISMNQQNIVKFRVYKPMQEASSSCSVYPSEQLHSLPLDDAKQKWLQFPLETLQLVVTEIGASSVHRRILSNPQAASNI